MTGTCGTDVSAWLRFHTIVLTLLLSSLGIISSPIPTFAQQFYPMQPGNRWSYRIIHIDYVNPADSSARELTAIGDTLMANGKIYHQLNRPDVIGATFVREDSNFVYYYSPYDTVEVPMYNLKSEPGVADTIQWPPLGRSTVTSSSEQTILGKVTTVREYTIDGLVQYKVTLAKGLGIIGAWDMGDAFRFDYLKWDIRGAVIDNTLYGILVDVKEMKDQTVEYSLTQNFPNPFNPFTTIQYALPQRSHVTLTVYSTLGQKVALLVNGEVNAGHHEMQFNASNLASGVYLYRLTAADFIQTRAMLLVK